MNPAVAESLGSFGSWGSVIVLTCFAAIVIALLIWWFDSMPKTVWYCPHCHKRIKDLEEARKK